MNEVSEQKVMHIVTDLIGTNGVSSLIVAMILGVASGMWWIVRRVFTNQKQVELLEKSLLLRDDQRKEDRDNVLEIRDDVKDLTKTVTTFIAKQEVRDEYDRDNG